MKNHTLIIAAALVLILMIAVIKISDYATRDFGYDGTKYLMPHAKETMLRAVNESCYTPRLGYRQDADVRAEIAKWRRSGK